jgi:choline transport protein
MDEAAISDAAQLASLGYVAELPRKLSSTALLGMAFAILNSWSVLSASLSLSLSSGGPSAVIWGLVTAGFCNICLATSLAEFLSAYPTAGGQYHWTAVISPQPYATRLAWSTGWITCFGWMAVTASGSLLGAQLVVGLIASRSQHEQPRSIDEFFLYIGFTLIAFMFNCWMENALSLLSRMAFLWSILGFVIIPVVVLACSHSPYADPSFVFSYFVNKTGWAGSSSSSISNILTIAN